MSLLKETLFDLKLCNHKNLTHLGSLFKFFACFFGQNMIIFYLTKFLKCRFLILGYIHLVIILYSFQMDRAQSTLSTHFAGSCKKKPSDLLFETER